MIDWEKTTQIGTQDLSGFRPKVIVRCDKCNLSERAYTIRVKSQVIDNQIGWVCPKCISNTESERQRRSEQLKAQWADEQYVEQRRGSSKQIWSDPIFRDKHAVAISDPELRKKYSESAQKSLVIQRNDPTYKARKSAASKAMWGTEEFRNKWRLSCPNNSVSNLQLTLYSILDDLGIKYYREYNDRPNDPECIIGPWAFDCVIPRHNQRTLLVECNGEYYHGLEHNIRRDKAKANYIANNLSHQYELKCLWEHEFKNHDRIYEVIKYWMGITHLELVDYDFKQLSIGTPSASEYKLLLGKYHYLSNAGRGGLVYGAYLDSELIAVCVFSPLVRQNIHQTLNLLPGQIREISRLCIHPRYQKYNLGSWFVTRCIKQLPVEYKCIIAYCDTTFNHTGAIYKACNFTQDRVVEPDYWYVSGDGWAMHKKTMYEHAKSMHMKEAEYALKMQYQKVYGDEKLRYVLWR